MGEALITRRGGGNKSGYILAMKEFKPSSYTTVKTDADTFLLTYAFSEDVVLSGNFFLHGDVLGNDLFFTGFDDPVEIETSLGNVCRVWASWDGDTVKLWCRILEGNSFSHKSAGIYLGFYK
ncbi:MAG: hypothetical protein IKB79_05015 [Oscillospiraceae bacterium]|nr:hypothetical protein [Oscillospiraceae bacterium]